MDESPNVNLNHVNGEIIKQTFSLPTGSPTTTSASMLNNSNRARIKNSSFSITTNTTNFSAFHVFFAFLFVFLSLVYSPVWRTIWWRSVHTGTDVTSEIVYTPPSVASLDLLHQWAAPNAILNTGGRADEVRCHPGTREEVIGLIEKFVDAQNESNPRMLWLSGPAGAGKTAIMQTVAERCKERGVPHANFFFFRQDSSRSFVGPLVATLMHQLIQLYPSLGNAVAAALASNPLLFQMGLQQQFDTLVHLPFTAVQHSSSAHRPVVLLIDGLDECDSQGKAMQWQLVRALDTLLTRKGITFRVVVASRVEPQIAMAFKQVRSQVDSIFLDDKYAPELDIRLFVAAEFNKIKSTHYLAHMLDEEWPSNSDIDDIVTKSSGQFIYAATVMRFIMHSSSSAAVSLQRARGIVPPAKNPLFAHLDAAYTYILEQVDDPDTVRSILACTLVMQNPEVPTTLKTCLKAYLPRYFDTVVDSCIAELNSLVQIRHGQMRHKQVLPHGVLQFFHASFPDFLQDKSRAGNSYIDLPAFCAEILPKIWTAVHHKTDMMIFARLAFARIQQPTPEITAIFINPAQSGSDHIEFGWKAVEYLELINKHYDLYADNLPMDILTIWRSSVRYLVMTTTAFDCNERPRIVRDWKAKIESTELEKLLPENLRLELSA